MIPGMNPRQMQQMMRQMGIQQVDIPAQRVIIECKDKVIVIDAPQVAKVNMMGQQTWQVVGAAREEPRVLTPTISQDDIQTVMDATGASAVAAKAAIERAQGDLAAAIMSLQKA